MNKTLKKILATVSAVTMCAVSMTTMTSGAIALGLHDINKDTISFTCQGLKYTFWEEATDYFEDETFRVYISEPIVFEGIEGCEELDDLIGSNRYSLIGSHHNVWEGSTPDKSYDMYNTCPMGFGEYLFDSSDFEEKASAFEEYLSEHGINYSKDYRMRAGEICVIEIYPLAPREANEVEYMQMLIDIKEDTGLIMNWYLEESSIRATDVVNALPEVTLSGDADCNGKVSIDDVVLIMQSIANPDKYQMTIQGIVNADVFGDGDGVTISDAIEIQSMVASHAFD